ncbi:putative integrase, partial [Sporormia fimetaria CBS 119925]
MGIQVQEVPVEAHNSIGKVERYHGPLRRAFNVIAADLPGTREDLILQMAVKAVNDTSGPNGLVPTLLVFGTYPRLTDESPPAPGITARATAIRKAMVEVRAEKAKHQVSDALGMRNGPSISDTLELPLQSEVKVWREKKGWRGPFVLLARDSNTCTVDINGKPTNFRITVVKPYHRDD